MVSVRVGVVRLGGVVCVEEVWRVVPRGPAVSQGLGVEGGFSNRTVVGGREL